MNGPGFVPNSCLNPRGIEELRDCPLNSFAISESIVDRIGDVRYILL